MTQRHVKGTGSKPRARWTKEEIVRIRRMYRHALSYADMARGLATGKNPAQIARRIEREISQGFIEHRRRPRPWEWTAGSVQTLSRMHLAGASTGEIAKALKCRPGRVTDKIRYEWKMGNLAVNRHGRKYRPEEDRRIIEDYRNAVSAKVTARAIERKTGAVQARIRNLVKTGTIKRKREPRWTARHTSQAGRMHREGAGLKTIAARLKRSENAVYSRLKRTGQWLPAHRRIEGARERHREPWTVAETEQALALQQRGLTYEEIGTKLHRSKAAVMQQVHKTRHETRERRALYLSDNAEIVRMHERADPRVVRDRRAMDSGTGTGQGDAR